MSSEFSHYSVMLSECIDGLNIKPSGLYVDCTAGGGGHSLAICEKLDSAQGGHLIAIDQDPDAIAATEKRLSHLRDRFTLVRNNFSEIDNILDGRKPDGVIIDLGISSHQVDTPERGFSYNHDAPLDMRMNPDAPFSCADLIATYSEERLYEIIRDYGEERFASKIARAIVNAREIAPIESTLELVSVIKGAFPQGSVEKGSHPAKRTFQALRIEVNRELDIIPPTVNRLIDALAPGGRLVILTFHSLEDRAVKQTFALAAKGCTCPPDFPMCVCGKKPKLKQITKKPILPSAIELEENHRSHSAKLRIAEKL